MLDAIIIIISVILGIAGQACFKYGMNLIGKVDISLSGAVGLIPKLLFNLPIWCGVVTYFVSVLLWLMALSRIDLGYAYPFKSVSYVFILIIGYLFFQEQLNLYKIAGTLIICSGIFVLAKGYN